MAFQLRRGQPISDEARRVFDHQLSCGIVCLRDLKTATERDTIHEARRHVKKARAVLRVLRPSLGDEYRAADRRLRAVNSMLGELADARAMAGTLGNLIDLDPAVPGPASRALRAQLDGRAALVERQAQFEQLRHRTTRLLEAERRRVQAWQLKVRGRNDVIPVIEHAHRAARTAMRDALRCPTADTFHAWRRRVKREWHLLRLIAERCGNRLDLDERRLGALAAGLGELHNVDLLQSLVATDSALSRRETAHVLLALRRYRRYLRREAREMRHILEERPETFGSRVREAWGRPTADTAPAATDGRWPRVA